MIKNLNYILILISVALLAAIGVVFIFGATYSWLMSEADAMWRQTALYQDFVDSINMAVGPLAVALVVVLALCIPKRLFSGKTLLQFMGILLAVTAVLSVAAGARLGIGFLLLAAIVMQVLVILMTAVGSKRLLYEVSGFYIQIGSACLHMGLILFLFDLILVGDAIERRALHLNIFWPAMILMSVGMVMTFYSREISGLFARRRSTGSQPS
jgi:hypothetical protein